MKKIILIAFAFVSLQSFAQTQKIVLSPGQKISISQSNNNNITISAMGQEIESTSTSNLTTLLEVKTVDDNKNVVSSTLQKMKVSGQSMGSAQTYDSENADDKNSEMGKMFGLKLNIPEEVVIDNTGKEIITKKTEGTEEPANPMAEMLSPTGSSNVSNAFMVMPANAKAGYSWVDSSTEDKIKTIKKFTVQAIKGNEAITSIDITVTGEKTVEAQGMEMNITLNTKTTGEITSDITTGLVKKNVMVTEMNNTMDMMGNSSPMTGKINTTITYTPVQ
jgi:hypothetical protein